jgi:NAD(P)-dependent dehydrogenase (short-subunit alcohol dehydrogenase family)
MRGLQHKRVLVSGGSSGIGAATARRFVQEGCEVFVGGLDSAEVDSIVGTLQPLGQVHGMAGDVSIEGEAAALVETAVQTMGGLDVLANNAGTAWREPFLEITPEHWDRMAAVNLRGMFLVGQAAARKLVAQSTGGAIINMSSVNGLAAEADYAHYNATKAAVLLLTRTMAVELGQYGIRVNALCPGYIETPLNDRIVEQLGAGDFAQTYAQDSIPLGRTGQPDEVAAAYAFLASDDASFITGSHVLVDGGILSRLYEV